MSYTDIMSYCTTRTSEPAYAHTLTHDSLSCSQAGQIYRTIPTLQDSTPTFLTGYQSKILLLGQEKKQQLVSPHKTPIPHAFACGGTRREEKRRRDGERLFEASEFVSELLCRTIVSVSLVVQPGLPYTLLEYSLGRPQTCKTA
jgi:hypothetical protein